MFMRLQSLLWFFFGLTKLGQPGFEDSCARLISPLTALTKVWFQSEPTGGMQEDRSLLRGRNNLELEAFSGSCARRVSGFSDVAQKCHTTVVDP
jgi:hypothetical protein